MSLTEPPTTTSRPPSRWFVDRNSATLDARVDLPILVAAAAVALLGLNQSMFASMVPGLTIGTLVVLALLPVWIGVLRQFRFATTMMVLAVAAVVWGAFLSRFQGTRTFDSSLAIEFTLVFLTGMGGLGLLLWARTVLPTYQVALVFGIGYLLRMLQEVPGSANAWKYQVSVPLTIIVLALASKAKSAVPTLGSLLALGLISVLSDSRSYFGFCLLAAVLVIWQRRPEAAGKQMNKAAVVGLIAVALFALYSIGTNLLVQGYLGQANQQRTVQQIEDSGSLLIGGRPEWTGTLALMREQPFGFGLGTTPSSDDVMAAKSGIRAIGTDTENGYVNNYMFGGHFKLHSIVADLWATFGWIGFTLGIVIMVALGYCLIDRLASRTASGLVCLLAVLGLWDMAFGPIYKNLSDVMIALALTLTCSAFALAPPSGRGRLHSTQISAPRGQIPATQAARGINNAGPAPLNTREAT